LEAFLRVAFPEYFPPGGTAGQFAGLCQQRVGHGNMILSASDTQELLDVLEYANRFHHDTNPAWQNEDINDGELRVFVERTLNFAKR